eukprot:1162066-Pelagomonas_calceolata.AAC.7
MVLLTLLHHGLQTAFGSLLVQNEESEQPLLHSICLSAVYAHPSVCCVLPASPMKPAMLIPWNAQKAKMLLTLFVLPGALPAHGSELYTPTLYLLTVASSTLLHSTCSRQRAVNAHIPLPLDNMCNTVAPLMAFLIPSFAYSQVQHSDPPDGFPHSLICLLLCARSGLQSGVSRDIFEAWCEDRRNTVILCDFAVQEGGTVLKVACELDGQGGSKFCKKTVLGEGSACEIGGSEREYSPFLPRSQLFCFKQGTLAREILGGPKDILTKTGGRVGGVLEVHWWTVLEGLPWSVALARAQ